MSTAAAAAGSVVDPAAAVAAAAAVLASRLDGLTPRAAIVLGSGLGAIGDSFRDAVRIPYADLPGFPDIGVHGHAGEFIAGVLEDVPVLVLSGRFHLYEGHDAATVARPARVAAELGVEVLIVTNAAGGLRPTFRPPLLMLIADHVNLMWRSPLLGTMPAGEERFPDMACPYDAELRSLARDVARERGILLEEGVYAAVLGPSYETPAEIRMLRRIGADAVGMSTVPEVLAARARGIRVLGVSSITNWGAGISDRTLSHADVLEASRMLSTELEAIVRGVLGRM